MENLKIGLPHLSALVSQLFNNYINEQPISNDRNTKHFIYADDSAITVQDDNFEDVKSKLLDTLNKLG